MIKRMIIIISIILILTLSYETNVNAVALANGDKRVLMISSYSPSFMTFFHQIDGVKSVLEELDVTLDIEFMDSKRFYTEENLNNFLVSLSYKLSNQPPYDVIITSDDNALNFVLEYKDELFPNVPIVFLGVNDIQNAHLAGSDPLITGVIEASSIDETIKVATMINPKATEIIALTDNTNSGQGDLLRYYAVADQFKELTFSDLDLSNYTFDQFKSELGNIDNNSIVLLLSVYSDVSDNRIDFFEGLELVIEHCNEPVYHPYFHGLGDGIIGGKVISHFEQGKSAGEIVRDILSGVSVETINVSEESPNRFVFDYNVLSEYGIDLNILPEESDIMNYEPSFFQQYWKYLLIVLIVIIAESSIIIFLARTIKMKHKAESSLKSSHELLKSKNIEIKKFNSELEDMVEIRTSELEATMQELTATLQDLETTQESLFRNKMMESFINLSRKLSHQINTPLGVSLTSASNATRSVEHLNQIINSKQISKKELEHEIAIIKASMAFVTRSLDRSIDVINRLQRFTTYEPLNSINVKKSIAGLFTKLEREPFYKRATFKYTVDKSIFINLQESLFYIVIESLVENAVNSNEDKDLLIEIQIEKKNDIITISVYDNGRGIPDDIAQDIFEPFFSTNPHRIGMGLFIVKNIVHETLQGEFYLDESISEGCKFIIEFKI